MISITNGLFQMTFLLLCTDLSMDTLSMTFPDVIPVTFNNLSSRVTTVTVEKLVFHP
jgi:hypothetical protein